MAVTAQQLTGLYLAYFGRPPDFDGFLYYTSQPNLTVAQLEINFSNSPESQALYGAASLSSLIDAIYMNLFNRHAEPAGIVFWSNAINGGFVTPAGAAYNIMNGAQNADKIAVQNKLQVATDWLAHLDTSAEITGYNGAAADASARAFLQTVDSTPASLTAAEAGLDAAITAAISGSNPSALAASISAPSVVEGNVGDAHQLAFVVTLNHTATAPVTLSYITTTTGTATPGSDFQAASGTVSFAAGETSKVVNVTVFGDIIVEGNETVGLQVSGGAISNSGVTSFGTIVDDDLIQNLTTGIDTINVASLAGANTIRGVVDGGTPSNSTFSVGDTIHGNGQTTVELDVSVGGTGGFAFMDGVAAVNVVMGVASTINFNAIEWTGVGAVNLSNGVNGGFVHITSLVDGADLSIASSIGGHIAATYQDSELVSLLNTGKGGAMFDASAGNATVHLNTNGATASITISSTAADVTAGDIVIDGSANSATAHFVGVAPVGKDLTLGDVTIAVGDSSINKVTVAAHDIAMGVVGQAVGASGTAKLAASASGDMVIGGISQVVGTSGSASMTIDGSGDITLGDLTQAVGSGAAANATIDISEHGTGDITVGDVVQAAGNFVSFSASQSAAGTGDITIGDVSQGVSNTGGTAYMYVFGNSASGASVVGGNVTVGDVSQAVGKSGYAYMSLTTDGTGDIVVGDITTTGGAKATGFAYMFANSGNITAGNISMTVGDGSAAVHNGVSAELITTGATIVAGDIAVHAGKDSFAGITVDNNAGATAGNVTVGNVTATVGNNISGGSFPFAWIDVNNEGAKGKNVTVGDVNMSLGLTASGSISITNEGFGTKSDAGNLTVGNVTVTMADKAIMTGTHNIFIGNHQTGFTSASWLTKNKVGNLTVGDFHADMGTGAHFQYTVSNELTGTKGGAVGNLTVGDVKVTADVNSTAQVDLVAYNSASGNVGNVSVGDVTANMNDGGSFTFTLDVTATGGKVGNVAAGDLNVDLGVQGHLQYSIDVIGSSVGNVSMGDINIVLGEDASATTYMGWSVTASTGDIGMVSVGDINISVGQGGFLYDPYFYATASNATGAHIAGMSAGDVHVTLAGAASTTTTAFATAHVGFEMSGYAVNGGEIDSVNIGDMTVTLGKSATINYPVYLQFSAGSIGDVAVGMDTVVAGTNAVITNSNVLFVTATSGDIGSVTFGGFDVELAAGAQDQSVVEVLITASAGSIGDVSVGDMKMSLVNSTANTSGGFTIANAASATGQVATSADMFAIVKAKGDIGDVTFGNLTVNATSAASTLAMAVSVSNTGAGDIGNVEFGKLSVDMTGAAILGDIAVHVKSVGNIGDVTFGGFTAKGTGTAEIYAAVAASGDVGNVGFGDVVASGAGVIHAHVTGTGTAGAVSVGDVSVSTTASLSVNVGTLTGDVSLGDITMGGGVFALHFTGGQPTSGQTVSMGTVTFNAPATVTIDAGTADVHMAGWTLVAGAATTTNIIGADANLNLGAGVGALTIDTFKLTGTNAHNWNEFGSVVLPALTGMATTVKVGTVDLSGFSASDSSAVLIDVSGLSNAVKVIGTGGNDIITANAKGDNLTGGAGTDHFITQTQNQNVTSTTLAATAKITTITDFKAGPAFGETVQVDAWSGSVVGKYAEKSAADFNTAVTTALAAMADPVLHSEVVAVQVGADTYLFVDQDGGHNIDEIVKLVGVSTSSLNFADLVVV